MTSRMHGPNHSSIVVHDGLGLAPDWRYLKGMTYSDNQFLKVQQPELRGSKAEMAGRRKRSRSWWRAAGRGANMYKARIVEIDEVHSTSSESARELGSEQLSEPLCNY